MKQTGFRVCANCKSVRCAHVVPELRRFKMAAAFIFWPGSQIHHKEPIKKNVCRQYFFSILGNKACRFQQ